MGLGDGRCIRCVVNLTPLTVCSHSASMYKQATCVSELCRSDRAGHFKCYHWFDLHGDEPAAREGYSGGLPINYDRAELRSFCSLMPDHWGMTLETVTSLHGKSMGTAECTSSVATYYLVYTNHLGVAIVLVPLAAVSIHRRNR